MGKVTGWDLLGCGNSLNCNQGEGSMSKMQSHKVLVSMVVAGIKAHCADIMGEMGHKNKGLKEGEQGERKNGAVVDASKRKLQGAAEYGQGMCSCQNCCNLSPIDPSCHA